MMHGPINIRFPDKYVGNPVEVKYLGTTLNNKNDTHEETESSLNWRMFAPVQLNIFFSHLVHKNTPHTLMIILFRSDATVYG